MGLLDCSSNHYSLGWGARGARRLKNVVVVLDWVPDTSKLHVLPPAKHLSPEELVSRKVM